MAKFWFVSAPLFGHLDWGGFMKTALALQAQGHEVLWVSQAPIAPFVEERGVAFASIPQTGWLWPPPPAPDLTKMHPMEAMMARYKRALDTWLSPELVGQGVRGLLDLAERTGAPDVIATDPFLTASAVAAEKLGVKLAVCGWVASENLNEEDLYFVQKELAEESRLRVKRLCAEFGVHGANFSGGATPSMQSPYLHISYFSEYWHQGDAEALPQTQFVGGYADAPTTPAPHWFEQLPSDMPLALITLGSVFVGDWAFFAGAAQAAYRSGVHPLVVIGRVNLDPAQKKQLVDALPPRTFLLNWVDFDHVMPRTTVIVHHGGMGTTHAALTHAIPQVIVPHAADQRGQARRASQAKVGLNLTAHEVQAGQLYPAIRAIARDEKVKNTCVRMAEELRKLGGAPRAAELLIDLAEN